MSGNVHSAIEARSQVLLECVTTLLQQIRTTSSGPVIIAIDGRSGVGKSTLAKPLAGSLGATLIGGDDFFAGGTKVLSLNDEVLADICIDRVRLSDALQALKSGKTVVSHAFDWETFNGALQRFETVHKSSPVVVVEGVYAAHPDFRKLIDISILIEVSDTERERRLIEREGALDDWERQWHRAEDWYFAHLAQPTQFDIRCKND